MYISYAKPNAAGDQSTTAVIRARFANDRLNDVQELFEANAWSRGQGHYGSRLAFDGKGYLFITVGDRQVPPQGDLEAHPAQQLNVHNGKVIRLHDDGRVPSDNPFVGREGALPQIWSYGHRNLQGLMIDAAGNVWETEHGPQGGDELNLIQPGKNYGWPVIGFGVNYRSGTNIHSGTTRAGMEQPVKVWVPSIATSGLMEYRGNAFPGWQGSFFSGGLVGEVLWRLKVVDGHREPDGAADEPRAPGAGRALSGCRRTTKGASSRMRPSVFPFPRRVSSAAAVCGRPSARSSRGSAAPPA